MKSFTHEILDIKTTFHFHGDSGFITGYNKGELIYDSANSISNIIDPSYQYYLSSILNFSNIDTPTRLTSHSFVNNSNLEFKITDYTEDFMGNTIAVANPRRLKLFGMYRDTGLSQPVLSNGIYTTQEIFYTGILRLGTYVATVFYSDKIDPMMLHIKDITGDQLVHIDDYGGKISPDIQEQFTDIDFLSLLESIHLFHPQITDLIESELEAIEFVDNFSKGA